MPKYNAITIDDILTDRITAEAVMLTEKDTQRSGEAPGQYRVHSGFYTGVASQTWARQTEDGPQANRQYLSILFKLHDPKTEKFRGSTFAEVSWMLVEKNGRKDTKSRLFAELMASMGVPASASLKKVLPAIVDTAHEVEVSEYFNVNHEDLQDEKLVDRLKDDERFTPGRKAWHFIPDGPEGDKIAKQYLADGYKSQGFVKSINKLVTEKDSDIPF